MTEVNPEMLGILALREIRSFSLEDVPDGSQHVIAAFEVLEHLLNPAEVLGLVISKLSTGGLFVFSTPNPISLEVQILRQDSSTLDQEHISVMSMAGLAIAATKGRFLSAKV